MANIFDEYNKSVNKKKPGVPENVQEQDPTQDPFRTSSETKEMMNETLDGKTRGNSAEMPANISNNAEDQQSRENQIMTGDMLGPSQVGANQNLKASSDSWSAEYTARGFLEESGTSLLRGMGNTS